MKKKPTLYVIIICLWTCCIAVLGFAFSRSLVGLSDYSAVKKAFVIALLTINTIVLAVLWFGSIKDFVFSVSYAVLRKKLNDKYADVKEVPIDPKNAPRVLLLYCTCNDFNAKALTLFYRKRGNLRLSCSYDVKNGVFRRAWKEGNFYRYAQAVRKVPFFGND